MIFAYISLTFAILFRSSRSQMFFKLGVLKNFAIFSGKHLCWNPFFNEVAGLKPETSLKKKFQHRRFPVNVSKFLRTASL